MIPPFVLRVGASGPGLTAGLAAVGHGIGASATSAALARGFAASPANLPVLEVGSASRMREAAYFAWEGATFDSADPRFDELEAGARTEFAFWGRDDFEPYRALAAPLPAPLPGAVPDPHRPWVILEGTSPARVRDQLVELGLERAQLHTFAPRSLRAVGLDRGIVRWLDGGATVGAVLGRSSAVVAEDGALADDAERLGRLVVRVGRADPNARARAIATVPPLLLGDEAYVRALLEAGPSRFASILADVGWRRERLAVASATDAALDPLEIAGRRLRKLREDPQRFFSESPHASVVQLGRFVNRILPRR